MSIFDIFRRKEKDDDVSSEEKLGQTIVQDLGKEFKPIIDMIKGALTGLKETLELDKVLTYEEVMKYFIAHKDDSPAIVKGALLKENAEGSVIIFQVFLDKDNKLVIGEQGKPLGFKKKAKNLDSELMQLFKNDDLVIVE